MSLPIFRLPFAILLRAKYTNTVRSCQLVRVPLALTSALPPFACHAAEKGARSSGFSSTRTCTRSHPASRDSGTSSRSAKAASEGSEGSPNAFHLKSLGRLSSRWSVSRTTFHGTPRSHNRPLEGAPINFCPDRSRIWRDATWTTLANSSDRSQRPLSHHRTLAQQKDRHSPRDCLIARDVRNTVSRHRLAYSLTSQAEGPTRDRRPHEMQPHASDPVSILRPCVRRCMVPLYFTTK